MGIMGHGYGSEFHLLRYLGYHRHELNRVVEQQCGGRVLDWLDSAFDARRRFPHLDVEWKALDFLDPDTGVISAWKNFWPQTGSAPNWDSIGLLQSQSHVEFLLVEAKAHVSELKTSCAATEDGGLPGIREALAETIKANRFEVAPEKWLSPYYQYANRLAHLHFLVQHNISARLVFIYFLGDHWPDRTTPPDRTPVFCPKNEQEWRPYLQPMYHHLGLSGASELEKRVHSVFLPV